MVILKKTAMMSAALIMALSSGAQAQVTADDIDSAFQNNYGTAINSGFVLVAAGVVTALYLKLPEATAAEKVIQAKHSKRLLDLDDRLRRLDQEIARAKADPSLSVDELVEKSNRASDLKGRIRGEQHALTKKIVADLGAVRKLSQADFEKLIQQNRAVARKWGNRAFGAMVGPAVGFYVAFFGGAALIFSSTMTDDGNIIGAETTANLINSVMDSMSQSERDELTDELVQEFRN